MTTSVVLVRGINVGGSNKLAMGDLRQVCVDAGCDDVATYIQSGNVVLRSPLRPAGLEAAVERGIRAVAGLEVVVMVRTFRELTAVVEGGVYADETDGTKRIVAFLKRALPAGALAKLDLAKFAPEECTLRWRELYFHLPNGQGRAKLPAAVTRATGEAVPGTARNWKTVEKLNAMAAVLEAG
jgi:uncharacterized protein (DUF1697 family)